MTTLHILSLTALILSIGLCADSLAIWFLIRRVRELEARMDCRWEP
jgi:hypothetical protein